MNRKKTPQSQVCNMFTLETVAKSIHEKTIPYTELGRKNMFNVYKHFFLILYPCVKAWNYLICDSFCCVSNFTYKFIMARKKKKNLLGLTHHESQPGGHLVVYQQLCFHYKYVTSSGSSRGTKIEGTGGFSWFLGPKWAFPAHSGI